VNVLAAVRLDVRFITQHGATELSIRLRRCATFFLQACLVFCLSGVSVAASGPKSAPIPVTLVQVGQTELREEIELFGSALPRRRVLLSPRVAGLVSEVLVDEGAWVQPGNPILRLESRLAEIQIEIAQSRLTAADAKRRDARRRLDDLLLLKEDRHVSETTIESVAAELDIATAELARENADLARTRELLDRHQVFAPFKGTVTEKHVEVGQWVQQDDPVVELVELDTLRIHATLPQRHYAKVKAGIEARVRFDALPGREFVGHVFARVAYGDDKSRSFPLLIDIDNREHLLAPGMSARVWVALNESSVITKSIPRDALVAQTGGERRVWRVREENGELKAYPVSVETGRAQGDSLEVISDELAVGDRVVLLGNETLSPGGTVVDRSATGPVPSVGR